MKDPKSISVPESNDICFVCGGEEVMKLDPEGMVYKGERVIDGGMAYKIFLEVMYQMKDSKSPTTGMGGDGGSPSRL